MNLFKKQKLTCETSRARLASVMVHVRNRTRHVKLGPNTRESFGMKLELDVNRIDGSRAVTIAYADIAQVDQLIACIDERGEIDGGSILSLALESETTLPPTMPVKDLQFKHTSLKVHAACV